MMIIDIREEEQNNSVKLNNISKQTIQLMIEFTLVTLM